MSFSDDANRLATAGADGTVRVWNYETGEPIGTSRRGTLGKLTAIAIRADGNEVTSGTDDGRITVWNTEAPEPQRLAAVPNAPADNAAMWDAWKAGDIEAVYSNNDYTEKTLDWKPQRDIEDMMRSAWKWQQELNKEKNYE